MFISFFESIKYVGHLFPLSFLRVFVGYFLLNEGLQKLNSDFLVQPRLADMISTGLALGPGDSWLGEFLLRVGLPNWQVLAHLIMGVELLVGMSFLIGYLVRPMALLGVALAAVWLKILPHQEMFFKLLMASHLTMCWLGAGRCLGLDYYFYKRHRGIWW